MESSQHAALEQPHPPADAAEQAHARAELGRPWAGHQGVEVEVPTVEPVEAFLQRRNRSIGARNLLGPLALEIPHPRAQRFELGPLVDRQFRHRFSATRGASRLNAQTPRAKTPSTIAAGIK